MEIIGLGVALGLIAAAACVLFYRKGLKDGIQRSDSSGATSAAPGLSKSGVFWGSKTSGPMACEEEATVMMKRYEAILSYDPYSFLQKSAGLEEGERV